MVHVALRCFSSFCFALCCFTKHCFTRLIEYVARPVVSRDASAISAICYSVLGFGRNLGNNIHVAFSWLWGKLEAGTCDGVLASAYAVGGNVLPMRCYADAILRHLCGDSGLFAKGRRSYLIWIVGRLCGHEETCHFLLGVRPRSPRFRNMCQLFQESIARHSVWNNSPRPDPRCRNMCQLSWHSMTFV